MQQTKARALLASSRTFRPARSPWRLTAPQIGEVFGKGLGGREAEILLAAKEERPEDVLSAGADIDVSLVSVVGGLVLLGLVDPDGAAAVDVAGAHDHQLTCPGGGQKLELDHRPDLAGDVGLDGVDPFLGNGPDRLGLAGIAAALAEPGDGLERMPRVAGDQFLLSGPAEDVLDAAGHRVDGGAAPAFLGHPLANDAEGLGAEVGGVGFGIQSLDVPHSIDEVPELAGRGAIGLGVVLLGVEGEAGEDLLDEDLARLDVHLAAIGGPLGDGLVVSRGGLGQAVAAEIDGLAVEHNVALPAGLVVAQFRNAGSLGGGGRTLGGPSGGKFLNAHNRALFARE